MYSNNLVGNLDIVREYFSHNMRTSTAMVVATVSIFDFGLGDDTENMTDIITESAYFLDIYDKGMDIMFSYVLEKPIHEERENIDIVKIIKKLLDNMPKTISEQGAEVALNIQSMPVIENNGYIVKALLELILCEEIKKTDSKITITSTDNTVAIHKEKQTPYPEIYKLFCSFLKDLNIIFEYNEENISLRFM